MVRVATIFEDKEMQDCIDNCSDCHSLCTGLIPYCMEMQGNYTGPVLIRTLLDCAEVCQTNIDFMLRGSDSISEICNLCANVCDKCAGECDRLAGDEQMGLCADACRRCSESCRMIAQRPVQGA